MKANTGPHTSGKTADLKKGKLKDRQIVPKSWAGESQLPVSPDVNFYGYQWWLLPA